MPNVPDEPTEEMCYAVRNVVSAYAARKIWEQMCAAAPKPVAKKYDAGYSGAWMAVCETLSEVSPGWASKAMSGRDCAVLAIKRLAGTEPVAAQPDLCVHCGQSIGQPLYTTLGYAEQTRICANCRQPVAAQPPADICVRHHQINGEGFVGDDDYRALQLKLADLRDQLARKDQTARGWAEKAADEYLRAEKSEAQLAAVTAERDQQERFKWTANVRADKAEANYAELVIETAKERGMRHEANERAFKAEAEREAFRLLLRECYDFSKYSAAIHFGERRRPTDEWFDGHVQRIDALQPKLEAALAEPAKEG